MIDLPVRAVRSWRRCPAGHASTLGRTGITTPLRVVINDCSIVSDSPSRQWSENLSSQDFHSVEPLIATTVSRLGPARLGRPGLLRFGFAITHTVAIWVSPHR